MRRPQARIEARRPGELRAILLVLSSAAGFGAIGVLAQLAYATGVPTLGLLAGRFTVAASLLWVGFVALRRRRPARRDLLIGVVLGAGYSPTAICFAESLTRIEPGLADLLLFTYPVLVSVGAVALGRERWSHRRALALGVTTAGIALALAGASAGTIDPLGVALALASALVYALYVLAAASLLRATDPLALAALVATGAAAVVCADAAISGQLVPRGGLAGTGLVVAVALTSSVLGTSAFLAGVRRLGAARASVASSTEPALTAAFAFAVFGQRFGTVQILGAALVLASVPILEFRCGRGRPAEMPACREPDPADLPSRHHIDTGASHAPLELRRSSDRPPASDVRRRPGVDRRFARPRR